MFLVTNEYANGPLYESTAVSKNRRPPIFYFTQACVRVSSPPALSMYSFSNDGIGIFVVHMVRACVFTRAETETISEFAHDFDSI